MLGEVDDPDPLLERVAVDQALPGDAELPAQQALSRPDLVVRVPIEGRVRQLDDAAVVRPGRALEDDRPRAADAEHGARQEPRVVAVQPESARVGVDVAELVGQQEEVAVLEDLDAAEVGRLLDRDEPRLDEPAPRRPPRPRRRVPAFPAPFTAVGRWRSGPPSSHSPSSPPVSVASRSAWSAMISASISRSISPSMTRGSADRSSPIRWSVSRSWGKL